MGPGRRADLAAVLERTGLIAIEDAVYSFLADTRPLACLAPDRVILVDSLSKRVMPSLTLGLVAAPPPLTDRLAASIRQGAWTALGLSLAAGMHWMAGGAAAALAAVKRRDAAARQEIAREALADLRAIGDRQAYHLWLELPETWRAEAFAAAALRQGIALIPAPAFAVAPGHAPNAVRLALAVPSHEDLAASLRGCAGWPSRGTIRWWSEGRSPPLVRRQHEDLAGVDQIGIADLGLVGVVDHRVALAAPVGALADPPEVVAAGDLGGVDLRHVDRGVRVALRDLPRIRGRRRHTGRGRPGAIGPGGQAARRVGRRVAGPAAPGGTGRALLSALLSCPVDCPLAVVLPWLPARPLGRASS